ncbi:MAG: DNA repair protein RadA, partial [Bacteroidia bacterium]|nr:DNA repair protein RadA [Bacteroidia bacterium]
ELFILAETNLERILLQVQHLQPQILIIDSIQTLLTETIESAPGSISQVRECALRLMRLAKETHLPIFLIGHVTKEGSLAGPKVLEHMVDTVLSFEGDRQYSYRIVRTNKNRFGSTSEIGIYEMKSDGLRQVNNPSEIFLSNAGVEFSGVAISATMEGMRPLVIETQALTSEAAYGNPQRSATGYDLRRMSMLLAVLEKKCGYPLASKDVFLNVAGGIKIEDPALDLGLVCAIVSSLTEMPISRKTAFCGEIGLTGEIRSVIRLEQRIAEVEKLGFQELFVASSAQRGIERLHTNLQIRFCSQVTEIFRLLW